MAATTRRDSTPARLDGGTNKKGRRPWATALIVVLESALRAPAVYQFSRMMLGAGGKAAPIVGLAPWPITRTDGIPSSSATIM